MLKASSFIISEIEASLILDEFFRYYLHQKRVLMLLSKCRL